MFKQIDVVYGNEEGEQALALPVMDLKPKDSILLRSITGLNPPDVDLFIGEYSRDGGVYQGRRAKPRNPVITVDLNPNYALGETVDGLREIVHKTFMDPHVNADYSQIILRYMDGRSRYLVGYTEKIEDEIFGIETTMQISMICPDPFIRDLIQTQLTNPAGWLTVPFVYKGTAETGFETNIAINVPTSVLTLSNNNKTMVITYPFLVGDAVYINTNRGERSITLTRTGVTTPLIAQLSSQSRWLELHSQANSMTVYGTDSTVKPASIKELTFTSAYWGA